MVVGGVQIHQLYTETRSRWFFWLMNERRKHKNLNDHISGLEGLKGKKHKLTPSVSLNNLGCPQYPKKLLQVTDVLPSR